jgi:uncharacterized membrane protein YbhN (UPF0104 family)
VAALAVGAFLLYQTLRGYDLREVMGAIAATPANRLLAALLLASLGYLNFTGYDLLGLRYIGKPLPYRRTAFASFVASAVGHTLGHNWLTGGSVRFRFYSAWGLSMGDVAAMMAFCVFSFWVGFATLVGVVFTAMPPAVRAAPAASPVLLRSLGVVTLAALAGYLALAASRKGRLTIRGREFRLPPPRLALGQMVVGGLDLVLASVTIYVLLPAGVAASYPAFLGNYLIGIVAGLASQVPGGLGVLEWVLLALLAPGAAAPAVLGSLLVFRVIYRLVPLALAAVAVGIYEAARARRRAAPGRRPPAGPAPHAGSTVSTPSAAASRARSASETQPTR